MRFFNLSKPTANAQEAKPVNAGHSTKVDETISLSGKVKLRLSMFVADPDEYGNPSIEVWSVDLLDGTNIFDGETREETLAGAKKVLFGDEQNR